MMIRRKLAALLAALLLAVGLSLATTAAAPPASAASVAHITPRHSSTETARALATLRYVKAHSPRTAAALRGYHTTYVGTSRRPVALWPVVSFRNGSTYYVFAFTTSSRIPSYQFSRLASHLPACRHEDSLACYWDARTRGNHRGTSFVSLTPSLALYRR